MPRRFRPLRSVEDYRRAKSSCRIAARVAGRALQWEQRAVVRLMWQELLWVRNDSRRN